MSIAQILIVDDDASYAAKLSAALEGVSRVEICHSEAAFRERFAIGRYELLIIDMRLDKDREGLGLVREALDADPMQAVIVMTAYADLETYTDALESGAMTYLDKREFSPALIARTVEAIIDQARMRRRLSGLEGRLDIAEPLEIIGASPAIRQVRNDLRSAAETDAPVILVGEPGTGKELVARNIHQLNKRRTEGPFVRATCNRIQSNNFTQKIFGSLRKKNKGNVIDSKGWIDEARSGVLLLDGVEELDEAAWAVLDQLIDSGTFIRPGSGKRIASDVQLVIAITPPAAREVNDKIEMVGAVRINLPALREHAEDIALITQYTLQNLYRDGRTQVRSLRGATLTALEALDWPGNVRELKSAIEYAAIRADAAGRREISPEHLPQSVESQSPVRQYAAPPPGDYQRHLVWSELDLVETAIKHLGSSTQGELAERLGYNDRFIFMRRLKKNFDKYPELQAEFPKVARMTTSKRGKKGKPRRNGKEL